MGYIIGIDGGGTGSVLKIFSIDREQILTRNGGPTNISAQSKEDVESVLEDLIIGAIEDAGLRLEDCISLCLGTAGADSGSQRETMKKIIEGIGIRGNIIIKNDAEIALMAGAGKLEGVIIIAGTGSIGYGRTSDGISYRAGGWGHIIGDEGSGYYIGMRALNAAFKSYDGRGEKTILLPKLMDTIGVENIDGLMGYVYSNTSSKRRIAALAKIVDDAFEEGDAIAKKVLEDSAHELFLLADAIIRKLNFEGVISLVVNGSVIKKNDYIFDRFSNLIYEKYDNVKIIKLDKDAAYGAVDIALKYNGKV